MSQERHRLIEAIFDHALAISDSTAREEYLGQACAGGEGIEDEVRRLLASYESWTSKLNLPQPTLLRCGAYECVELLGTGGMGSVYRARRADGQYEQQVAVKLLRGSLHNDAYRARFAAERQILAHLNHPNIARLLDGGMTDEGEPYLVMEFVDGEPLDVYCDRRKLAIDERLSLFIQVLGAVDSAHRNLVVHRDLKPSNILVNGDGAVKLLDFGISKLLVNEATMTGMLAATPAYASPEQLRGEPAATTADVFSLGVVLFRLLTGADPFGESRSYAASIERALRETVPVRPDTLLTDAAAEVRSSSVAQLKKRLRGDLTSILGKALAHDPARRYPSVASFGEDLRRYEEKRPVLARQHNWTYLLGRAVRRHVRGIAAAVVFAALVLGAGAYSWRERIQGAQRLEEARSMAKYLLFDLYDRVQVLPGSTAVRARMAEQAQSNLDKLAKLSGAGIEIRLETVAGYNRLAEIQGISGTSSLGNTQAAGENLSKARRIAEQILAEQPGHPGALIERARNALLGAKLQNWNRRSTAAARPLIDEARRDLEQTKDLTNVSWLRAWASQAIQRADLAEFERDFASEKQIAEVALAELENWPADLRTGGEYLLLRVALLKRHGNANYHQEQFEQALESYQEAHRILEVFDSGHPNRPEILYALMDMSYQMAYSFGELKRPQAMLDATRSSIEIGRKLLDYDPENQALRRSYWNKRQALAESLAALGRLPEAVGEQEAVLKARVAAVRAQPDTNLAGEDVLVSEATLATILRKSGARDRACSLARESMERSRVLHASGGMTPKNWAEQQRVLGAVLDGCAGR
jgi:non-specific serine/threonine protein kinase/serine/threonine-protein kinase